MRGRRELPSQRSTSRAVARTVPVVKEELIVSMRRHDATCVPDRTPILLGPCSDLLNVGEQSRGVAAIKAIQLFDRIEIRKSVPIDHEVPTPRNDGDAGQEGCRGRGHHRHASGHLRAPSSGAARHGSLRHCGVPPPPLAGSCRRLCGLEALPATRSSLRSLTHTCCVDPLEAMSR